MLKQEFIDIYGEGAYKDSLRRSTIWNKKHLDVGRRASKKWSETHPEESRASVMKWREEHPEVVRASNQERGRKGGKNYEKALEYWRTGIAGEKKRIRTKHQIHYRQYKNIIAPGSQIHHEWIPGTADYRGVALVEADQHMHGIVDVIEVLDGKITIQTEEDVRNA
jgi:hypothetical protein